MVRLAEYSRDCLRALRRDTALAYDDRQRGTLQLFRTQKQMDHVGEDTQVLDEGGVPYEVLDPAGCIAAEPALAHAHGRFLGGLRLPGDETGDAHQFTQRLAAHAASLGVDFRYGVDVQHIEHEAGRITAVVAGGERFTADHYVVAFGSYSRKLLLPLGFEIPVYPVKGYSITVPIEDEAAAPVSTVMDETYKVAITRLGDRIRVGGTAELAGFSALLSEPRRATLGVFGGRPVSQGWRRQEGQLLDRAAADDAGWHADRGADQVSQSVAQHRPRHAGLDDGMRVSTGAGGPGVRRGAGDRGGRSGL